MVDLLAAVNSEVLGMDVGCREVKGLHQAVLSLPIEERIALLLTKIIDLDIVETAQVMSEPEDHVRNLVISAMQKICASKKSSANDNNPWHSRLGADAAGDHVIAE